MNKNLNLEIKNFGLINEANIELNKINVIGGINSSGKSTASKLLYCLLKANSTKRKEYLSHKIISNIIKLIKEIDPSNDNFSPDDDYSDIIKNYDEYKQEYIDNKDFTYEITSIISNIENFIDLMELDGIELSSAIAFYLFNHESLYDLIDKAYYLCGEEYGLKTSAKLFSNEFEALIRSSQVEIGDNNILIKSEGDYNDEFFDYLTKGSYNDIGDVFYISPVSMFDIKKYQEFNSISRLMYGYEEHVQDLLVDLEISSNDSLSNSVQKKIKLVQKQIIQIIQGDLNKSGSLNNEFYSAISTNTSSGIKQIGILQILLNNNKLKPGTFLIIDEPEVNLHPEWQFKFAEILVLIAKELDVQIYLNSHSPLFIESIDAFTEYYDMEDDINYYLTEKFFDAEGGFYILHNHMEQRQYNLTKEFETYHKFNFTKINSNELFKLYNNLGNPYHLIDQLRLRKKLGE